MIVVDASAVIEMLLRTRLGVLCSDRLLRPGELLCAPHLLDVEVLQVLRRYAARGELPEDRGDQALGDFADLPLQRYPHQPLLTRIWDLRHLLSAYDAAYVALAEALDAPACDLRRSPRTRPRPRGPDRSACIGPESVRAGRACAAHAPAPLIRRGSPDPGCGTRRRDAQLNGIAAVSPRRLDKGAIVLRPDRPAQGVRRREHVPPTGRDAAQQAQRRLGDLRRACPGTAGRCRRCP